MKYYGFDMTINTGGKTHVIEEAVIKEIFRQLNIQTGKNILENYEEEIGTSLDNITDDEFEEYANKVEEENMCDNGDIEWKVMERMFGTKEDFD